MHPGVYKLFSTKTQDLKLMFADQAKMERERGSQSGNILRTIPMLLRNNIKSPNTPNLAKLHNKSASMLGVVGGASGSFKQNIARLASTWHIFLEAAALCRGASDRTCIPKAHAGRSTHRI